MREGKRLHRRTPRRPRRKASRVVIVLMAAVISIPMSSPGAMADVDPERAEATVRRGESVSTTTSVDVPEFPPKLDLFLEVDLTGSYSNDLPNIKAKSPEILDGVRDEVPDSRFGLGTFVDFPFSDWGDTGEWGYRLEQGLTSDGGAWLDAVDAMETEFGADTPESQYEALYQAATGAGREMPPTSDGDFDDRGEIEPGQDPAFRTDAAKVLAITTDAPFHEPDDSTCWSPSPCPFGYPGPDRDETVEALNDAGIAVVAIKAPGAGDEMDDIAEATGGVVTTSDSASEEIADAILGALEELTLDVAPEPVGCDPLELSFDPPVHEDVAGGTTVTFEQTISAPADARPQEVRCEVRFRANDALIGTQDLAVQIVCGDGLETLEGTPAEGAVSRTSHDQVEPAVGSAHPDLRRTVEDVNCDVVVPLEDQVNEST